ncbi:MAG: hypothetical protein MK078_14735 [Crocinitomicaceae bacterium]|nr:hypothetical protein [Crocinitomicaceae bacterium]
MIVYDSKKWTDVIRKMGQTFKQSYNLRQLAKFMAFLALYVIVITFLLVKYIKEYLVIEVVFFSLIGVILSLFLVFRLNSAYDRWWEGRKQWGKLVNDSRTFALNLNALLPEEDKKRRRFFVRNISNFSLSLQNHLRDNKSIDEFIHVNARYAEDLETSTHIPNRVVSYMYTEVEDMYREGIITDMDKHRLNERLQGFIDVLGACERIKKTPIPFSHSTFIKMFVILYLLILPFGLVETFGFLAIPAVMIMGFALLSVELISDEIENPFGLDANDLPLGSISDGIRESCYEILRVKSRFATKPRVKEGELEVLH